MSPRLLPALFLLAAPLSAQVSGGITFGRESAPVRDTPGGLLLEPRLGLRAGPLALHGEASVREGGPARSRWMSEFDGGAALALPSPAHVALNLEGGWRTTNPRWSAGSGTRDVLAVAAFGGQRHGFSVGAGPRQAATGSGTATAPMIRVQGWATWRGIRFAGLLQHFTAAGSGGRGPEGADTMLIVRAGPTVPRLLTAGLTEAGISGHLRVGRIGIGATAGMLFVHGASTRLQGSVTAVHDLSGPVALTAGYSRRVFDPIAGRTTDALRMGLTLRTSPLERHTPSAGDAAPTVAISRDDLLVTLGFEVAGAKVVELRGEVTGWEAVRLRRDDGRWTWRGAAAPGASRLQLRIDGGPWIRPPGSSAAVDPYGEPIGLVVIP